ncbi:MAG: response regulator [Nitrospiria bacterium]
MLNLIIVEDDPLSGKLLTEYVTGDDVTVNALYTSGEEALEKIPALPLPDVVLMDVGLPGISGIEATRRLKEKCPQLEIMIQTIFEDSETIFQAIKGGASGYILKASTREEIHKALKDVAAGGSYLSAQVARKVVSAFRGEKTTASKPNSALLGLTDRERDILNELIRGKAYKKIGEKLNISVHTVNNHIRKIYEKLQVNSRGEAVAKIRGHD